MNPFPNFMVNTPEDTIQLTSSYTSENGHTYFKSTMFTKRLVISYSIGEGYAYKFLNGITIYAWDGEQTKVIAQKNFTETTPYVFTEEKAKREAVELLKDYLLKQAEENGVSLGAASASQLSTQLVEEAFE
jgi:hypothetical protein